MVADREANPAGSTEGRLCGPEMGHAEGVRAQPRSGASREAIPGGGAIDGAILVRVAYAFVATLPLPTGKRTRRVRRRAVILLP
ncbi:hypothetical protein ASA1KI_00390 [Opitutales bacterium ASA1]|nr:hypothetical protein ASA1KI_00390 [Opitutales bacterium ASA1]